MTQTLLTTKSKSGPAIQIIFVNLWLSAVLAVFLVLRVIESRAFGRFLHAFSLR